MYGNIESALLISNIENALLIADLEWIAARLPKQDNIWAGKLLRAYDAKGDLSPKQAALAQSILNRAKEAGVNV